MTDPAAIPAISAGRQKLVGMLARLREKLPLNTSSHSAKQTRTLVAEALTDKVIRKKLLTCSKIRPCNSNACPVCDKVKATRYFNGTLKRKISINRLPTLRWITVNVCETDTLDSTKITTTAHESLVHIFKKLHENSKIAIWGCRDVEPKIQNDNSFKWLWHWHLIVDLDVTPESDLVAALRKRWPADHAVHVSPVRGRSRREFRSSLRKLASYPVKARYTYRRADGLREWLPYKTMDDFARWRCTRGAKWARINLGTRDRPTIALEPRAACMMRGRVPKDTYTGR